jgi:hypothetical protein
MIHIPKFIDRVSLMESKQNKDVVLPISEARGIRDELVKLLIELKELNKNRKEDTIQIEIDGGSFK